MHAAAKLLAYLRALAMLALVVMMLVTIVDVTMRLVINELVLGSVEIVQLALVTVVFLAMPEAFLRDEHIAVDLIDQALSERALARLRFGVEVVTTLFLCVLAWRMVLPALDTLSIGDLTSDLQISLFWYWLPIVVGGIAAAVTMLLLMLRRRGPSRPTEP
jgi:TRAP-type C4-dicarboxylate transport system permease small subunit